MKKSFRKPKKHCFINRDLIEATRTVNRNYFYITVSVIIKKNVHS